MVAFNTSDATNKAAVDEQTIRQHLFGIIGLVRRFYPNEDRGPPRPGDGCCR